MLNQVGTIYIFYSNELYNLIHQKRFLLCQGSFSLTLSHGWKSFLCLLNEFSLISPKCSQIWEDGRGVDGKEKDAIMNFYKIIINSEDYELLDFTEKEPRNAI